MDCSWTFWLNSVLFGIGLAMDAFSVSLSNGLNEPQMSRGRMSVIAGVYAFFQFAMPMIGWLCVRTIVRIFTPLLSLVPWIALLLLGYIGIKMFVETVKERNNTESVAHRKLGFGLLIVQGIATSIDALSVGFTIAECGWQSAVVESLIIAAETFCICMVGLALGKRLGMRLSGKAGIIGGVILIAIGVEIFIKGVFFG